MGKKVRRTEAEQVKAQEAEAQEAKTAQKAPKYPVKVKDFLKSLHLEWLLDRGLEPGDLDALQAQVKAAENGSEWASWWIPYKRADGSEASGIAWGISVPLSGGILILKLFDSGESKATIKIYRNGKGILTGVEPVVKALLARPDIQPWTDQDTAALL